MESLNENLFHELLSNLKYESIMRLALCNKLMNIKCLNKKYWQKRCYLLNLDNKNYSSRRLCQAFDMGMVLTAFELKTSSKVNRKKVMTTIYRGQTFSQANQYAMLYNYINKLIKQKFPQLNPKKVKIYICSISN